MGKTQETTLTRVGYTPSRDIVSLHLSSGARVEIPRGLIKELRGLNATELRALKPDNAGMTLSQRALDIDVYVPGLLADTLALNASAMLGQKGGAKKSPAKRRASQENGKRGGRPKKPRVPA
ncbi:MAG: hypothetical protein WBG27_14865 [Candidatus Aquilonibacter sp.]